MKIKKHNITYCLFVCGLIILFLISASNILHAQYNNLSQTQESIMPVHDQSPEETTQDSGHDPGQEEGVIQDPEHDQGQEGVIQDPEYDPSQEGNAQEHDNSEG